MAFKRKRTMAKRVEELAPGKAIRQTTTVGGKRMVITQTRLRDGTVRTTAKPALALEVDLQAAQVTALLQHPEYGRRFILAGDMNAAKRGSKAISDALRSGMTEGEPDLRLYFDRGRLALVENKEASNDLSKAQVDRHSALAALGHHVETIYAATEARAVELILEIVEEHLNG
jgi:hypothetical protein